MTVTVVAEDDVGRTQKSMQKQSGKSEKSQVRRPNRLIKASNDVRTDDPDDDSWPSDGLNYSALIRCYVAFELLLNFAEFGK